MDYRRLDTAQVLASGILGITPPKTDMPEDREEYSPPDFSYPGTAEVIEALEAGKLVRSPNYYGIPSIWKDGDGAYRGILMQYRSVTEDKQFTTAEDAEDWFRETYYNTDG